MDVSAVVNDMSSGAVISGGVVSCTVTVWVAVAELSEESVAVHVTVVVPSGNDEGESLVTVGLGSWLSVAVARPMLSMVSDPVASAVMPTGAVMVGGVVSLVPPVALGVPTITTFAIWMSSVVLSVSAINLILSWELDAYEAKLYWSCDLHVLVSPPAFSDHSSIVLHVAPPLVEMPTFSPSSSSTPLSTK